MDDFETTGILGDLTTYAWAEPLKKLIWEEIHSFYFELYLKYRFRIEEKNRKILSLKLLELFRLNSQLFRQFNFTLNDGANDHVFSLTECRKVLNDIYGISTNISLDSIIQNICIIFHGLLEAIKTLDLNISITVSRSKKEDMIFLVGNKIMKPNIEYFHDYFDTPSENECFMEFLIRCSELI